MGSLRCLTLLQVNSTGVTALLWFRVIDLDCFCAVTTASARHVAEFVATCIHTLGWTLVHTHLYSRHKWPRPNLLTAGEHSRIGLGGAIVYPCQHFHSYLLTYLNVSS